MGSWGQSIPAGLQLPPSAEQATGMTRRGAGSRSRRREGKAAMRSWLSPRPQAAAPGPLLPPPRGDPSWPDDTSRGRTGRRTPSWPPSHTLSRLMAEAAWAGGGRWAGGSRGRVSGGARGPDPASRPPRPPSPPCLGPTPPRLPGLRNAKVKPDLLSAVSRGGACPAPVAGNYMHLRAANQLSG